MVEHFKYLSKKDPDENRMKELTKAMNELAEANHRGYVRMVLREHHGKATKGDIQQRTGYETPLLNKTLATMEKMGQIKHETRPPKGRKWGKPAEVYTLLDWEVHL